MKFLSNQKGSCTCRGKVLLERKESPNSSTTYCDPLSLVTSPESCPFLVFDSICLDPSFLKTLVLFSSLLLGTVTVGSLSYMPIGNFIGFQCCDRYFSSRWPPAATMALLLAPLQTKCFHSATVWITFKLPYVYLSA